MITKERAESIEKKTGVSLEIGNSGKIYFRLENKLSDKRNTSCRNIQL